MNNDLEQFSEERLMKLSETKGFPPLGDVRALARIALAAKQAKPVGRIEGWNDHEDIYIIQWFGNQQDLPKGSALYTTPQPAHTEQDGWIKCSERMPEETEDSDGGATGYLVRYENDRVPNGGFNIGVSNCVYLRKHWRGLYSHWMPLPAAPKPESE